MKSKDEVEVLNDLKSYGELVGSHIYVTMARPDISFAVQLVSQFVSSPRYLYLSHSIELSVISLHAL